MSINALSNAALARRADFEPANAVPSGLRGIARASGATPRPVPAKGGAKGAAAADGANGTNTALQTLTTYIPTEVLTLYVAAVAALGPVPGGRWAPFLVCLVATPALVWIAFATKLRSAGKRLPSWPSRWPVWEMFAGTLAYVAWAFAMPDTPFAQYKAWYSAGLASFLILVVSSGLGIIAPLMQWRLRT
jgi:hypothetical protein